MATTPGIRETAANGAALAAYLGAGIGALALGLLVVLNEAHLFAAPALYPPAGGVSGRTTFAAAIWLIGWATLHRRWKGRHVNARRVHVLTLILLGLAVVLTFPLVWKLL
jgi:hypothetical protein